MATGKSIKIRELTECSLCLERFTRPKALPCQHCFCFDCLVCVVDGNKFVICPQCRKRHTVPKSGVVGFEDHFLMNNLLDIAGPGEEAASSGPARAQTESGDTCADCSNKAAVKICPHCDKNICADCLIVHTQIDVLMKATGPGGKGGSDSAVTSKPSAVTSKPSVVPSKPSVVTSKPYAVTSKQSAVTSKQSAVTSKPSAVKSKPSTVTSKPSEVTSKPSAVTSKTSTVTSKSSAVTSKTSTSAVTSKPSTVKTKPSAVTSKPSAVASQTSTVTSKPSAVTSKPSAVTSQSSAGPSRTLADRQTYSQNQLPRNVDYRAMRGGPVTVIGRSGEKENRLGLPEGCAYHVARREVYVADLWNHRVMVYDRDGSNKRVFYKDLEYSPRDVAVSTDGQFVYIVTIYALIKTNMSGECVKTIKTFSRGEWECCIGVYCHREFTLVVDAYNSCVVVFDQADKEIRCFGQEHLKQPVYLAVSEDGQVYVTDEEGSSVHVFTWEGVYLRTLGVTGEDEDTHGIAADSDGNVCVARGMSDRIHVYDPQGEVITTIGSRGVEPGQLSVPAGLCLTPDGCLVVTEWGNNRVQIFGRERDDHC